MANTGNIIVTERDINPFSQTYNATRTRTYRDEFRCVPEGNLGYKVRAILDGEYTGLYTLACNHTASGYNSQTLVDSEIWNRKSSIINCIVGDCVTWIHDSVFYNCQNMETVYIANTVYHIHDYAFAGCSKLTELNIPDSVQYIGDYAFERCSNLVTVTIGTGITQIRRNAFINNPSLTSVTIKATTPPQITVSNVDPPFIVDDNAYPIYVPAESVQAYKNDDKWGRYYYNRIQPIPS